MARTNRRSALETRKLLAADVVWLAGLTTESPDVDQESHSYAQFAAFTASDSGSGTAVEDLISDGAPDPEEAEFVGEEHTSEGAPDPNASVSAAVEDLISDGAPDPEEVEFVGEEHTSEGAPDPNASASESADANILDDDEIDQTVGLNFTGDFYLNWSGSLNEKWLLGDDGQTWYFITPDGNLWRWMGGDRDIASNCELVAGLSAATYDDPALLYNA